LSVGKTKNFASFSESPNFKFVRLDVSEYDALSKAFNDIDWVFHLAALADIVPSIETPESYFQSNVVGTFNVAKLSVEKNVKRIVYAASSSCYGIPESFPTSESTECDPRYPYALTKYLGEQIMMHWNSVYNLPVVCLRLFNVYGPRARTSGTYGAVFGVFLAQKLAGAPFTIVGDGTQTRDFTFVSDVCQAFLAAAESEISGEIMNVGSGNTYEVNELVRLLGGPVVHIPKRPGEPDCTFADITKIRRVLDWSPTVNLEKGVGIMLDHINDWRDAPLWDSAGIENATKSWFKYLGKESEVKPND
jgi:UDP-glucose 4-epimerase